jgi:GxxExxY protein
MLVEECVVVEIKSVEQVAQVHEAELLMYLTATGKKAGLLINFGFQFLCDGIKGFVL